MIAKLTGIVDSLHDGGVIVDVSGIGFFVYISDKDATKIKECDRISLSIMHIFRQEQQFLCGFLNNDDKDVFTSLLNVHGIGIKSAFGVLSTLTRDEIAMAVINQDAAALCRVSGIGSKTAARILLELKDQTLVRIKDVKDTNSTINDAVLGLMSLGYQKNAVLKTVQKIANSEMTIDEIIVKCLQELS